MRRLCQALLLQRLRWPPLTFEDLAQAQSCGLDVVPRLLSLEDREGLLDQFTGTCQRAVRIHQRLGQVHSGFEVAIGEACRLEAFAGVIQPGDRLRIQLLCDQCLANPLVTVGHEHRVFGLATSLDLLAADRLRFGRLAELVERNRKVRQRDTTIAIGSIRTRRRQRLPRVVQRSTLFTHTQIEIGGHAEQPRLRRVERV